MLLTFVKPSTQQQPVTMLTRIPSQLIHAGSRLAGSLACLSTDKVIIFDIDESPKAVPRHMKVGATPKRMIYSPQLKALVVASSVKGNAFNTLENRKPDDTKDPAVDLSCIDLDT